MIKTKAKLVIRYLNPTLLLAPIIPIIYSKGVIGNDSYGYEIYLKSLLIIIPLYLLGLFSRKCKHFISYFFISAFIIALITGLMILLGPIMTNDIKMIGIPIVIGVEMIAIFIHHLRVRLIFAQQLEEEGRISKSVVLNSIFTTPSLHAFFYFGFLYVIALGLKSKIVCDEIFINAVVYLFMYTLGEFISGTERYLEIHHSVAGIPKKRVYGIGLSMVGILMIVLFIATVPSLILINHRPYYDLSKVLNTSHRQEFEMETQEQAIQKNDMGIDEMMLPTDSFEWPEWVKVLSRLFIVAVMGAALFLLLRSIVRSLSTFKNSFNENDDIIENLEDEKEDEIEYTGNYVQNLDSQTKKIRRQYKKTILKARKEKPQAFESPTEMEIKAGLFNSPEMRKLHMEYEKARYGE